MSREIASAGSLVSLTEKDDAVRVGRADGGLYDDEIICFECEKLFKRTDDYAINFRRRAIALNVACQFPYGTLAFPSFEADAECLHAFAITTLFRASISSRWEHRQVNHALLEEEARSALFGGLSTMESGREVCLEVTTGYLGKLMGSPVLHPVQGHPVYRMQMPNLNIFVAASDAGLMPGFREIALRKNERVTVWRRRRPLPFELLDVARRFDAAGDRTDRMMRKRI